MRLAWVAAGLLLTVQFSTGEEEHLQPGLVSPSQLCDTCKFIVTSAENYVSSPEAQKELINFMINNVCTDLPQDWQLQCDTMSAVLVPQFIQWFDATFDPDTTCVDVGVCSPTTTFTNPSDNLGCPLCKFVVNNVVQGAQDPRTGDFLRREGKKACEFVGSSDAKDCSKRVDVIVDQMENFLSKVDVNVTCSKVGFCWDESSVLATLLQRKVASIQSQVQAASTDLCEVCQIVVMEAAALLSDPKTQAAITGMAKSACNVLGPTVKDECNTAVDTYAPMVFNLLLMYLKPLPMCSSIGLCTAETIAIQSTLIEGTVMFQK